MFVISKLREKLGATERHLEAMYPYEIQELAGWMHESSDIVDTKVQFIAHSRRLDKFVVLDILLAYYRFQKV